MVRPGAGQAQPEDVAWTQRGVSAGACRGLRAFVRSDNNENSPEAWGDGWLLVVESRGHNGDGVTGQWRLFFLFRACRR